LDVAGDFGGFCQKKTETVWTKINLAQSTDGAAG
jgi:hypothetical protein